MFYIGHIDSNYVASISMLARNRKILVFCGIGLFLTSGFQPFFVP